MITEKVWTERYRPDTLDEVIGHDNQIGKLKKWVDDDTMPHLLFHGPAGTGKSSSAVAFAKDRYGEDWEANFIELNASDDRGIDVVRDQIKSAASQSASSDYSYKIIFLDECDSLTKDAQAALRRIMEKYTDQTRFILSCNWKSKLIDPIQSRCSPIAFNRLPDDKIEELLLRIIEAEDVEYEDEAIVAIIDQVNGDARRAVKSLWASVQDGVLDAELVEIAGGQLEDGVITDMVNDAFNGHMGEAQEAVVTEVLPNVVDYSSFTADLMKELQYSDEVPRDVRYFAISKIGELERNIMEGCNPHVQINSFLHKLPCIRYAKIPNYDEN